ncbi:hypothetical protein BDN70DRAFT_887738 [Pholiota conissans]|uniref:Uncharacterized protein n=1 Tax=Pholiota conissans TaxID=109636 RepID=A0A9P5YMX8_9AGAR|nr:hypothetical protein BDN70DRAFT_887738 [Pholiota conissans]
MKFATLATLFVAAFAPGMHALSLSNVVERAALDVFAPPVTSPNAGTVWTVGSTQEVTWDTSNAPVHITNGLGQIMLAKGGEITPVILASKFDILQGSISVVVPWVQNGTNYEIILFGDSGNISKDFTIDGSDSLF